MFVLTPQDRIFLVTLSGRVTADEVTAFYDRFNAAIEEVDQVGLVIDMTGFDDMTGEAIARDIPLELGLLDEMGKFPKAAIVSDKEFMAALVQAVNPLLPMIDMQVFGPADMAAARAFAADLPERQPRGKGIRRIDASDAAVMAYEIDGYMEDDDLEAIAKDVIARVERGDALRVLIRIVSFRGFDPAILTEGSFYRMKFGAIRNMKKYAIVSDEKWMKPLLGFAGSVTGIDIRQFPLAEEEAAWAWVRS